jgi:hypothetical protein
MRRNGIITAIAAVLMLIPVTASAQSAQTFSAQFSGLGSVPFGGGLEGVAAGVGWEAQIRMNPSVWSFGVGVEQTFHDVEGSDNRTVTLLGGFFEPRVVILVGSDKAAPYLAARAALSQTTFALGVDEATASGFTINGGGGVLVRLSDRVNLDLGVTVGFKDLGTVEIADTVFDMGSGANTVVRAGLAIGLGG